MVVGLGVVLVALVGEDGFLAGFQIGFNFGMDMLAADDESVGIVDGGLGESEVVGFLEGLEVLGTHSRHLHLLLESGSERLIKGVVVNGIDDFRVAEQRVVFRRGSTFQVERH